MTMRNLLREGLKRFVSNEPKRASGTKHATVIAVTAQKGGVGKTTTTVNLGAALARELGLSVLLIDLDPQGHVQRSIEKLVQPGGSPLSALLESEAGGDVLDCITHTAIPHLDITLGDPRLRDTENLLTARIGKELILRDALTVTRTWYDVILIDCPPNLGNLTVNALVAADRMLIPCDPTPLAMQGVVSLLHASATISDRLNPQLDILGIVITRFDGRNQSLNDQMLGEMQGAWGDAMFPTKIGINTSLARAQAAGEDIFVHAPKSRGAADHAALARDVLARLQR